MAVSARQVTVELNLDTRKFKRQLRQLRPTPKWVTYYASAVTGFNLGLIGYLLAR